LYAISVLAMPNHHQILPKEGDKAPAFTAETRKGTITFPDYAQGNWCIVFAHPANFTSAWMMFNTFMVLKERWFDDQNTKLIGFASEPVKQDNWSDKVRRYIDIYLKAPLIEDPENRIAQLYGLSAGRRIHKDHNRVAFIIDPEGVIRLIIKRPIESIESAIKKLETELNRLQGKIHHEETPDLQSLLSEGGLIDQTPTDQLKPAYFGRDSVHPN
jgi:alkyl hydroperoxide reductase subunit AhpC